jgi:nitrogen fixation protein FixH
MPQAQTAVWAVERAASVRVWGRRVVESMMEISRHFGEKVKTEKQTEAASFDGRDEWTLVRLQRKTE